MSYQAIARKWRPRTFREIAGQDHVTRTLRNAIELGRIHHAFLFTGARGVGKTSAARILARALNCERGPAPEPCGECATCRDILAGVSPAVVEIDGASNNSVDDVRELRENVRYPPATGRYRVYIVDEVHMLSKEAFNALLKTLEEPPEHVVFIFATTEPHKIPQTVLSRVQRFDFKRIAVGVVAERLELICRAEEVQVSPAALRMIARAGEGSMRDAQSLLDQVIAFAGTRPSDEDVGAILGMVDRSLLHQMLEGLLRGRPEMCLDAIARVYDGGHELSRFTTELLELLRNAALVVLSPSCRDWLDLPQDEKQRLEQICRGVDVDLFSRWFQVILEVHEQVSRSNRPRLVLEMSVARLASQRPVQPVDRLLDRLERVERRLRSSGARPRTLPARGFASPREPRDPPEEADPPEPDSPRQDAPAEAPPDDASPERRWEIAVGRLSAGPGRWANLASNAVLAGYRDGVLRVAFATERTMRHGAEVLRDAELFELLRSCFPDLSRVEAVRRGSGDGPTAQERRRRQAEELRERLRREALDDRRVQRVRERLGATLAEVRPLPEEGS